MGFLPRRWVCAHLVVLSMFSIPPFVTCSAAELTYSEAVKETKQGIEKDMEIYAGPPAIPQPNVALRSPEMLKWSGGVREARLGALERMDGAVIGMIEDGFKRGLSLDSIRSRTESCVTWLEWPSSYDNRHGEPLGFRDWNLDGDEWQKLANSVKVIHQTYRTSKGVDFHFFKIPFVASQINAIRAQVFRPTL